MNTQVIEVPKELNDVDALIYLVRLSDKASNLTREGLFKVKTEGTWSDRFSSWGEFVSSPDGLNKSEGWASKHIAIYKGYTLEGGVSQEKLDGIATESLYLALELGGSIEEKVARAKTLSRADLRKELQDDTPHEFKERPNTCGICGGVKENHS